MHCGHERRCERGGKRKRRFAREREIETRLWRTFKATDDKREYVRFVEVHASGVKEGGKVGLGSRFGRRRLSFSGGFGALVRQ